MTEKIPLFDLNDVLLGHSCRVRIRPYLVPYTRASWLGLGVNKHSRGVEAWQDHLHDMIEIEWFQPFGE